MYLFMKRTNGFRIVIECLPYNSLMVTMRRVQPGLKLPIIFRQNTRKQKYRVHIIIILTYKYSKKSKRVSTLHTFL